MTALDHLVVADEDPLVFWRGVVYLRANPDVVAKKAMAVIRRIRLGESEPHESPSSHLLSHNLQKPSEKGYEKAPTVDLAGSFGLDQFLDLDAG
jgi:hypothetical protein